MGFDIASFSCLRPRYKCQSPTSVGPFRLPRQYFLAPQARGPRHAFRVAGWRPVRAAQSAERPKRPAKRSALKKISWSFYVLRFLAIDHILYSRIANTFEIEKVHPL